jgi:hypothetical protein
MDANQLEKHIKILLVQENCTLTELAERITNSFGRSESTQNIGNKLRRGSLRYIEASEIAEALGYEIVWKKKAP